LARALPHALPIFDRRGARRGSPGSCGRGALRRAAAAEVGEGRADEDEQAVGAVRLGGAGKRGGVRAHEGFSLPSIVGKTLKWIWTGRAPGRLSGPSTP